MFTCIRIRLYLQTFCCRFKSLRVHTYPDSLRFRASTRIRKNDTSTLEMLTVHALLRLMNLRCRWALALAVNLSDSLFEGSYSNPTEKSILSQFLFRRYRHRPRNIGGTGARCPLTFYKTAPLFDTE